MISGREWRVLMFRADPWHFFGFRHSERYSLMSQALVAGTGVAVGLAVCWVAGQVWTVWGDLLWRLQVCAVASSLVEGSGAFVWLGWAWAGGGWLDRLAVFLIGGEFYFFGRTPGSFLFCPSGCCFLLVRACAG